MGQEIQMALETTITLVSAPVFTQPFFSLAFPHYSGIFYRGKRWTTESLSNNYLLFLNFRIRSLRKSTQFFIEPGSYAHAYDIKTLQINCKLTLDVSCCSPV